MTPKYVWTISAPFDQSACEILNNIGNNPDVDFEIIDPMVTGNDSGWCDMVNGHRFVTRSMIVKLMFSDEKYSTLIRLKFGDRAHLESMTLDSRSCTIETV
jgi:hypothetical protein